MAAPRGAAGGSRKRAHSVRQSRSIRLETARITAGVGAASEETPASDGREQVEQGKLVIQTDNADGFLAKILPPKA